MFDSNNGAGTYFSQPSLQDVSEMVIAFREADEHG